MDEARLKTEATKRGVIAEALPDAFARAAQHFGETEPSTEALDVWLTGLKAQAPHFFNPHKQSAPPEALPDWLSATERLTRYRQAHPSPLRTKPQPRILTQTELAELDRAGLSIYERLTRARELMADHGEGGST